MNIKKASELLEISKQSALSLFKADIESILNKRALKGLSDAYISFSLCLPLQEKNIVIGEIKELGYYVSRIGWGKIGWGKEWYICMSTNIPVRIPLEEKEIYEIIKQKLTEAKSKL